MKIYVAGKYEQADKVRRYAQCFEIAGHKITFKWYSASQHGLSLKEQAEYCFRGVAESDMCMFVFEDDLPYSGALAEFGMAIALKKRIVVIGKACCNNVFMNLPNVERIE